MLTGQIGLVRDGTSWVARGIEQVTGSRVFHVVVAVSETEAVGAEPHGAKKHPIGFYPNTVWSHFKLDDEQIDDIVRWTLGHIGTPYNYLDDAAIGFARILDRVHLPSPTWLERFLADPSHLQCAQLADMAYEAAGITLFRDHRTPGAVFPGSFVPLWRDLGWWK